MLGFACVVGYFKSFGGGKFCHPFNESQVFNLFYFSGFFISKIIPLTNKVANIEVWYLQQAVTLERAFRFGEAEGSHAELMFEQQVEKFKELARDVDKKFEEAIKFLEEKPAHTEAIAKEMEEAMNNLVRMAAGHKNFDALAEKAIGLLKAGNIAQARLLEEVVVEALVCHRLVVRALLHDDATVEDADLV